MLGKVLLAYDGSKASKCALELASKLCDRTDSNVTVLTVHPIDNEDDWFNGGASSAAEQGKTAAEFFASEACSFLQERKVNADFRTELGFAAEIILKCADELQAELVIIGHQSRKGIGSLVYGSVASQVFHKAKCPVLVAR